LRRKGNGARSRAFETDSKEVKKNVRRKPMKKLFRIAPDRADFVRQVRELLQPVLCLATHGKIAGMEVKVNVPDRLVAEAKARGVSLEMLVEEMLAQQAIGPEEGTMQGAVGNAIDRIRELRRQNTLGGLRTRDLIHEGHKY